jgi:hypothetical protein
VSLVIEDNIFGLEIPMDDIKAVQVLDSLDHFSDIEPGVLLVQVDLVLE